MEIVNQLDLSDHPEDASEKRCKHQRHTCQKQAGLHIPLAH